MKKVIIFFLLSTICFTEAFASVSIGGINYDLNSNDLTAVVKSRSNNVKEIVIPATIEHEGMVYTVTTIGMSAFWNTDITSILIPSSVKYIESDAFDSCTSLTSITFDNTNPILFSKDAFANCNKINTVTIASLSAWCESTFIDQSGYNFCSNPLYSASHLLLNGEEINDLVIPSEVTTIGQGAFYNFQGIASLTIPDNIEKICYGAFWGCKNIISLHIPDNVTAIGSSSFRDCSGLTSVEIGNGLTDIPQNAFQGCTNLTSCEIGCNVKTIYDEAFSECSSLSSIIVPDLVEYINSRAFYGCSSLKTVKLGSAVKNIGMSAFKNCPDIEDVWSFAENAPGVHYTGAFDDNSLKQATLHVYDTSLDSYKSMAPWNKFKSIKTFTGEEIHQQKCATPTIAYENGGLVFSCETDNVQFVSEVKSADIKESQLARVDLTQTYEITVYATREGYDDSDVATATITWRNGKPFMEGFSSITLEDGDPKGDVNGDGTIDVADIATVISIMAGK